MPYPQKNLPIFIILEGGASFASFIPIPFVMGLPNTIIRPESLHLTRPARGTVINTAKNAFLEDFGEGVGQIVIQGHTGWSDKEGPIAGVFAFKLLEEIFIEYLRRRAAAAKAGLEPDKTVFLFYVDTLNLLAFTVYPQEFVLERIKTRPLLYFYRLRFTTLVDLLQVAIFDIASNFGGLLTDPIGTLGKIGTDFLTGTGL